MRIFLGKSKKMKIRYLIIFILLTTFSTQIAHSQWAIMRSDADSLVRLGSRYIYNVEFDKAEECFEQVIDLYPEHPVGYFLDAMIDWWKITLFSTTDRYNNSFERKIEKVIRVTDKLLKENEGDINALFFKAGALGYRGRYFAQNENWLKAAQDGSEAYNLLIKCMKIAPNNHDIMLGTGIYNYFSKALPDKYPIAKPLMRFFPDGDMSLGLFQLRAASRNARYADIEAKVVLMQIYYSFENDNTEALKVAMDLHQTFPQNPYFHRYVGRILAKRGDMTGMENTWRQILIRSMDRMPGYDNRTAREAMYYVGLTLLRKQNYDDAIKYFIKSAEGSEIIDRDSHSGFRVEATMHIGNIYDRQGNRAKALEQYRKILQLKDYNNSHAKARRYIEKAYGS